MADLIYKLLIGGVKSLSAICDLRELTLRYAHHCIKMEWDNQTERHLLRKQMYTVCKKSETFQIRCILVCFGCKCWAQVITKILKP